MPAFSDDELATWYQAHEAALYSVVRRRVWDTEEAREIVQTAFLKLWDMGRVDPSRVKALLFRIALNLASNHLRRQRRWGWLTGPRSDPASLDGLVATELSPEARLAGQDREAALRRALETLPAEQRDVLLLTELSELSYREVALALEIPEGTVGSRRNLALRKLRAELGEAP